MACNWVLRNGLKIQWGKSTGGSSSQNVDAVFSVSFTNTNYIIMATIYRDSSTGENVTIHTSLCTDSYARLRTSANNRTVSWFAIGY
ncbi:gp53-like domain-containing protein [Treponema bryantii]|uniref:gp53-like domain-containing protein n=1 Tax=Treponema bryantii TaxID=163 RepID=UPI003F754369